MSLHALIVAAGRGTRAGAARPKQWLEVAGQRVIDRSLAAFSQRGDIDSIVVVLHPDDMKNEAQAFEEKGFLVATGGAERSDSVRNGLALLPETGRVLIHDAARCCVSQDLIDEVIASLVTAPAAAPGLPVTDALWQGEAGKVMGLQDRTRLFAAQTPQGFDLAALRAAHAAYEGSAADDVAVFRATGAEVVITSGSADNIKITRAEDFARAARILEGAMDIRTGNGFDVHAFGPGDFVTLCGIEIAHDRALVGHSDADVGMHTVTDAIYGALARGDIGQHFPPSDPQWKGAASEIFLRHAVTLAAEMGFELTHVDCTLICEEPKIGPHAPAMRTRMGEIMGLDPDRLSIKATTSERLGFTGRGEGIACMATATLVKR
ncbi:MAG: bifunctional 2-C-methyl-D-erythritol 4-phosphate cytidylyltransferase/2-C-methyl-D-erythritol 2,4-cyclodiphosphate synthase [Sulfitobacter sp.]|nr:bifunctional 2-C-methyl-D-erythritol 4-phosphate cytidylyltransferase/2-C-methyl-D-erythritol 2,4-cyclodiphosphate synthase [Sulfitobacter sp.]